MIHPTQAPATAVPIPLVTVNRSGTASPTRDGGDPAAPKRVPNATGCLSLVDYHEEFISIAAAHPRGAAYWRNAVRKIAGQSSIVGFNMHGQLASESLSDFACVERVNGEAKISLKAMLRQACIECECHGKTVYQTGATGAGVPVTLIAIPIRGASTTNFTATVCFALRDLPENEIALPAERLRSLLVQAAMHVPGETQPATTQSRAGKSLALATRVASFRDTREFAYALVGSLAERYGCGKVAFGLVDQRHVHVMAISGMDQFKVTSPGVVDVQQAMEEAFDCGSIVVGQSSTKNSRARSMPIHQRWAASSRSAIVSLPIFNGDETIAVVTLQREVERPLSDADIDGLRELLEPFGPAIALSRRGDRGFIEHAKGTARQTFRQAVSPQTRIGWAVRLVALAAMLVFIFGWMPYRPATPCMIVPARLNESAARFDMKLVEPLVRSGDLVHQGQVLARFDTKELELERSQLIASRNQAEVDVRKALNEGQAAVASLAKATSRAFQCQLEAVESKIADCTLTAPADGMVVAADLSTKIGQVFPQGEPILAFAPMDQWELQLHVPERLARFVEFGQEGSFAPIATPGTKHGYRIENVSGATEIVDGKNVIVAKASIEGAPSQLRHGMKGVARTNTGWRPIWWISLHGAYEYLCDLFWL